MIVDYCTVRFTSITWSAHRLLPPAAQSKFCRPHPERRPHQLPTILHTCIVRSVTRVAEHFHITTLATLASLHGCMHQHSLTSIPHATRAVQEWSLDVELAPASKLGIAIACPRSRSTMPTRFRVQPLRGAFSAVSIVRTSSASRRKSPPAGEAAWCLFC